MCGSRERGMSTENAGIRSVQLLRRVEQETKLARPFRVTQSPREGYRDRLVLLSRWQQAKQGRKDFLREVSLCLLGPYNRANPQSPDACLPFTACSLTRICTPRGRQCPTPSGSLVHSKCSETSTRAQEVEVLGTSSADPDW